MRIKVCAADRKRLIDSFESGQDFILLADILGINQSTARTIVRRHRLNLHQGRHGGHKTMIIEPLIGDQIIKFNSS